ncbi:MAG: hypothetical protein NC179_04495, partial [[Eubacterium] siraeum]|nr:hypothetical protein [[Eubacterium] siraeum]
MKSSKKAKFRKISSMRYLISTAVALLILTAFATFSSLGASRFAYADSPAPSDDTFSVLFPTVSYIQSDDPTLIAANDSYLIIYDKTARTMFVRGGDRIGTYAFPLDLKNVEYIKAVGNIAFIHADEENYTVDLKDTSATPEKRELTSPSNANYFRSDGTYLYAKNGYDSVSIYDENLQIVTFDADGDVGE